MTVNGKQISLETPVSVSEFLTENNYQTKRIAVEINGEILPKSQYESRILSDSDTIEIVTFMGGG
ncbi:MAG: sulfur carrier protein ThiS [Oscillospiraceae bacterium]|nr:sulfur carrier protein ThiS [Oscillospiraceae bacterium]